MMKKRVYKFHKLRDKEYFFSYNAVCEQLYSLIPPVENFKPNEGVDKIIPLIFIMRHSIELGLKIMILTKDPNFNQIKFNHKLIGLYERLKLLSTGENYDEFIKEPIEYFEKLDPDGFYFRYVGDKKGNKNLTDGFEFKLEDLKEQYDKFVKYFHSFAFHNKLFN